MAHVYVSWVNMRDRSDCGSLLGALPLEIGRNAHNPIHLPDRNAGISRQHARISAEADQIILTDCDSLNGVYIDNRPITQQAIASGTEVAIGHYLLTIRSAIYCQDDACARPLNPDSTLCRWCGQFSADAVTQFL